MEPCQNSHEAKLYLNVGVNTMKKDDLKKYYTWGLPLLGLMAALIVLSVVVTIVLRYWS
jgi:hypothetical protein